MQPNRSIVLNGNLPVHCSIILTLTSILPAHFLHDIRCNGILYKL